MREIGNILASAFLRRSASSPGLSLLPSVPGYARDMAGSILDLVLIELSRLADTALVIETVFREPGRDSGALLPLAGPAHAGGDPGAAERAGSAGAGS